MKIDFSPTMQTFRVVKEPSSPCTKQINRELLTVYRQAADLTNVNLTVIARENEDYRTEPQNNIVRVSKDHVAILLTRGETGDELTDLWDTVKLMEAELPNVRIG
jgi:hypothetical protein